MKQSIVVAAVMVAGLTAAYAIAQQRPSTGAGAGAATDLPRTISVTGTAEIQTAPDIIAWSIRLVDHNPDLQVAKQANDAKLERILALREPLALEPGDLETGHVRIQREFERGQHGQQGDFRHFTVSRHVTIRQRDLQRFDDFLDKLVASAEMEVSFTYDSTRMHEVRARTRLEATRIAQEKARAMAEVLGAQVGPVLAINEHRPDHTAQVYGLRGQNNFASYDPGSRPVVDLAVGRFAPGAIDVQVTVYTTFLLQ